MKISEKQLEIIRNFFADKPVKRAYLFGSYARGEAKENSDIDIIVDLDFNRKDISFFGFVDMKDKLSGILGRNVDLVTYKGLSKYIKPFVDSDKKLIYEENI